MASHGSGHSTRPPSNSSQGARLPDPVYRKRRLIALAVFLVLVVALVWGIGATVKALRGDPQPEATQTSTPSAVATATTDPENKFADFTPRPEPSSRGGKSSPKPSASAKTTGPCGAELAVHASTNQQTYSGDQKPVLILGLENTGENACRVEAGTNAMAFVVSSGNDQIFDSRHCAANGQDRMITLEPGQKQEARLTWDKNRTIEGCLADQGSANPGYYSVTVSLGDRTSEPAQFILQ